MLCNYNGTVMDCLDPVFHSLSRAHKFGDGFFETIKLSRGKALHLPQHVQRINRSFRLLKFSSDGISEEKFHSLIQNTSKENGFDNARVRANFFREGSGKYTPESADYSLLVTMEQLNETHYHPKDKGISLCKYEELVKTPNYISCLKTNSALVYVLSGIFAKEKGMDASIINNIYGRVAETTSSNIFMVKKGKIITPPLSEYPVDGIMRKIVIQLAQGYGYETKEIPMEFNDIREADEIFTTNAIEGIQWVSSIEEYFYSNSVSEVLLSLLNRSFCD